MIEQSKDDKEKKTAVLFSVQTHGVSNEENDSSLLELRRLVKTMGLKVVATLTQRRSKPESATLLGAGKLKNLPAIPVALEWLKDSAGNQNMNPRTT